jgi:hypothetical protein
MGNRGAFSVPCMSAGRVVRRVAGKKTYRLSEIVQAEKMQPTRLRRISHVNSPKWKILNINYLPKDWAASHHEVVWTQKGRKEPE